MIMMPPTSPVRARERRLGSSVVGSSVGTMLKPSSVKPDDYHALPGEEPVANPVVGEAQVLTVEEPAVRVVPPVRAERRCCRGCLATACCGLFICCAVVAGVALACVYGILNKPNVNVKHNVVNARAGTIVANFHNANPYAVDVGKLELVVWLKAGHKRALGRFEAREAVTVGRYSGVAVTLYNASAMDAGVVAKIGEKCADEATAKLKVRGDATMARGGWRRRRGVVSQWDRAPCSLPGLT